jgi:hypothetical protein
MESWVDATDRVLFEISALHATGCSLAIHDVTVSSQQSARLYLFTLVN